MVHTLTLDDIFAIERVTDAQMSPDGSHVAFVMTREFTEGEHSIPESSVWVVSYDGTTPARQFTASLHADKSPRWSPDGKMLCFLSDRAKADILQVYVMPTNGGEAQKLTDAKAGVSDFAWSPDGLRIAYLAADAKTEDEEKREKERDDPIHVHHEMKFTRLWVVDAAGGAAQEITPPDYQVRGFAWFHSGWAIVTSPTPEEDDAMLAWPVRVIGQGDDARTLWEGKYPVTSIASSRDGRALTWIHSGAVGEESADEVWVARAGEQPRLLTSDYSGAMAGADFTPDGQGLLLIGIEGTRTMLGRIALDSSASETLLAGRTLESSFTSAYHVSVSADGTRMACVLEDVNQPAEVFVGELGGEQRQATKFNVHLSEVTLGRGETVEWTAPDGLRVEGVLIYPAEYEEGKRYPLITHIHGGPTWQWLMRFMAGWHDWGQWLAAQGYAVLLPNPRGSAGRGREYAWSNRRSWGHGDFGDVLSGVDAMVERGIADPERLGIGGWSYGGYMTAWAIGQTDRFKAAIVGAGVTDLLSFQAADIPSWLPGQMMLAPSYREPEVYLRSSPITYVANAKTPTLVLHGASDERVRLGQGKELYHALRGLGVSTEMVIYPREPHIFQERYHQRDLLTRVSDWFDRWVKGEQM